MAMGIGSPPRAWGQLKVVLPGPELDRFTPTCVGTTNVGFLPFRGSLVHPHVRGDNNMPSSSRGSFCGSPPRAWGQRPQH